MRPSDKKISNEFREFMSAQEIAPPLAVQESVLSHVKSEMNPTIPRVFSKMLGVHAVVSLFSLSICSQFGIQTLKIYDAMDLMMSTVGHTYCMAFCGVLYFGISALALSFLLNPEEVRAVRRHRTLQFTLLAGVSLGTFLCFGAQILLLPSALWLAGSLIGGVASLELGWKLRSEFRRKLVFGI